MGITVGFSGDPNGTFALFDDGQSPTTVIQSEDIENGVSGVSKDLGIHMTISFEETFKQDTQYKETMPRELIIKRVDYWDYYIHEYDFDMLTSSGLYAVSHFDERCQRGTALLK